MSTNIERAYGAEQNGAPTCNSFGRALFEAIGRFAIATGGAVNLGRSLGSAASVAVLASALSACSLQGGQSNLGQTESLTPLPAPTQPGATSGAAETSTVAGTAVSSGADSKQETAIETVRISANGMSLSDAVGLAVARHPDISRAQAIVVQSESEVSVAKSAWYPTMEYGVNPRYSKLDRDEAYVSVGVNQLIYDFGRSRSRVAVANATLNRDRYELADTIESVAFNTASTFIDLAAGQEMMIAAEKLVDSLRETKNKIETRVNAGLSDASDLNEAEVAIQRAAAEALSARTEFEVAAGKLAEVAGIRPKRVQSLGATSTFIRGLGGEMQDAIEKTPSVMAAQAAMDAATARVRLARADRFPSIGLNAGQAFSTVRGIDGDYDQDNWVGLRLSGDFSTGGLNKNRIAAAEANERAEKQALENQRLVARTTIGSAETEAAGAVARLQSYDNVIGLSRTLIDLYWQQYTLDKRPLTDVINAERDIYQSEASRIAAIADGSRARVRANATVGRLVEQLKAAMSSAE